MLIYSTNAQYFFPVTFSLTQSMNGSLALISITYGVWADCSRRPINGTTQYQSQDQRKKERKKKKKHQTPEILTALLQAWLISAVRYQLSFTAHYSILFLKTRKNIFLLWLGSHNVPPKKSFSRFPTVPHCSSLMLKFPFLPIDKLKCYEIYDWWPHW